MFSSKKAVLCYRSVPIVEKEIVEGRRGRSEEGVVVVRGLRRAQDGI